MSTALDGFSAYELALEHGYQGTEAEWLASLKGETGERGEAGEAGKDASLDAIREIVAEELAQLPDPPPGPPGKPGPRGPAGPPAIELPARADFERDPQTKLTRRVLIWTEAGPVLEMVPRRDVEGLMVSVDLMKYGVAGP